MAAQQPPPNWAAFSAASRRVSQSTNQLVQALQASANVPADLATMSSELELLEHQPTNAMLQQQMQQFQQHLQQQLTALNHNVTARILNALLQNDTDHLSPLVNQQTNAPAVNFPPDSAALSRLSWPQKRALGISLGMNDPGANPNAAAKANFFTQLRFTIGLRPSLA